ncbi:O-antigen polymerase [Vibrio ichthyoenteri ATCC 700023]|uniref:O-antigen polymerase n=1 Tax=Vibrio ichthyoenteri ATCC 700023 TaxID=870968 RepID=F9S0F9_9VIBR|nr:O-antigen ligase family protein [Vibrio ichthyoenteri]EGU43429.1 O-antigen polymerase [Vibrio ichthyoenteri ATCC 700023]
MISWLERSCFAGLIALLIWLPIPLGSNRIWAWTIGEVWIATIAFVLAGIFYHSRDSALSQRLKAFLWLIVPIATFQVWVLIQIIPMPVSMLEWISPSSADAYQNVAARWGYISLDPAATYISLLKGVAYLFFICICAILIHSKKRLKLVMLAIVVSGTLQAFYASLNVLLGVESSWIFGFPETDIATGSFVYKNHLANYLLLCLSMGIGLIVIDLSSSSTGSSSWQERVNALLQLLVSKKMLIRFALIIMVIALVMTRSRMGNSAFFVATFITGIIALCCYKQRPPKLTWLLISLFVVDIIVLGSFFGLEKVQQRIAESHLSSDTRHLVVQWSIPMLKDFLLTGSGLGSFYIVFPSYTQHAVGFYDHAHNEYIQFVAEVGLPATLLLALAVLWAFGLAVWVISHRQSRTCKGAALGGLVALVAMLLHITVDFNLQAPANTVTFLAILAIIGASYSIATPLQRTRQQKVISDV